MSKDYDNNVEKKAFRGLLEIGLNGREAQIYLALIKLGEVGTTKICKETSLHRQYVYQYLATLEKKSLVQSIIFRGRKRFKAKNPEVLTALLAEKQKTAQSVIANIAKIAKIPEEQVVEVNQGEDTFVISAFALLQKTPPHSEILIIGGAGDRFVKILGLRLTEYEKLRLKKGITIRYVGSESQRVSLQHSVRKLFSYHLLPGSFTDITHTVIWKDFITLDTFGSPVTQTIIHNPAVSSGYKEFFETLWQLGK